MKIELVHFYVKDDSLYLYTLTKNLPPLSKNDHRLGLYVGKNDEHVHILPLTFGHVLNDDNTPQTKDRVIIGSVQRFIFLFARKPRNLQFRG
jgi:hypothetical protein